MLTFVIPVRHQDSMDDWQGVQHRLSETLHSVSAQTVDDWQCVVVANEGALLPPLPGQLLRGAS
jgi:hypothetical protein